METSKTVYGDIDVVGPVPADVTGFEAAIQPILSSADRGIWLRVPLGVTHAAVLARATELGFTGHHVYNGELTMQAWCTDKRNPTPPFCHHCIGAGGIVINAHGRVLGIRERFDRTGLWHVPGGHVDEGEELLAAGAREVLEETGVRCVPLGIASWYELQVPVPLPAGHGPLTADERSKQEQSRRFGSTHVGAYVVCVATDDTLAPDDGEIAEARWLPVDEFIASGHEEAACQVATMQRNGTIEALAKLAAAMGAGGAATGGGSASSPLASPLAPLYEQATRHLAHAVRVTSRHKRFPEGTYDSVHYSSLPHAQLASAVAGCKRTVAVKVLAPAELTGIANAGVKAPTAEATGGSGGGSGAATADSTAAAGGAAAAPCCSGGSAAAYTFGGALLFAAGAAVGVLLAKRLRW